MKSLVSDISVLPPIEWPRGDLMRDEEQDFITSQVHVS